MTTQSILPAAQGCEESSPGDYVTLLKPGVMLLVVFTGFIGMAMAPGTLHPLLQLLCVLAIALGSGSGAVINMYYDRDIDALMRRTAKRPIPAGRIHHEDALSFGLLLGIASIGLLGLAANWAAAAVLAFAIGFYGCFYTMWLKRRTPQNIVIGGLAGALPPLIGWMAVSPVITFDPLCYVLIIFLWTPPHFWALALYRHEDYAHAGIPMLPVVAGPEATRRYILIYTLVLVGITLLPSLLGSSGLIYFIGALALGGRFLWHALRVHAAREPKDAIAMFKYSILYLFMLFSLLLVDKLVDIPLPVSFS